MQGRTGDLESSGWSGTVCAGERRKGEGRPEKFLAPGLSWGIKPALPPPPPHTSALEVHHPGLCKL